MASGLDINIENYGVVERFGADAYTHPSSGAFAGLLWVEINKIERKSKMTARQAQVFDWHLRGYTGSEIAEVLDVSHEAVSDSLKLAFVKANRVPHRGLVTVILESFGWDAIRQVLSE